MGLTILKELWGLCFIIIKITALVNRDTVSFSMVLRMPNDLANHLARS